MPLPLAVLGAAVTGLLASAAPDGPYAWISTGGLVAFLLYFFVFAVPNKWVPRELHDNAIKEISDDAAKRIEEAQQREREWREIAMRGSGFTERTVPLIEAALQKDGG